MKEVDIRPQALLEQYKKLSLKDAQGMDLDRFIEIDCPACNDASRQLKFKKNGFSYVQCKNCGSVYCSPRPNKNILNQFYEQSESSHFWATVFFPAVAEARREKLFRKKALELEHLVPLDKNQNFFICDVGAGYGIFLEELQKVFPFAIMHAVEPSPDLAGICQQKGFLTLVSSAENAKEWNDRFDLVISSEVIEHVFSPLEFARSVFKLAKPGGKVVMTGLGYEGFDILVLQEKSNSIFPPHHINFLSIAGFRALLEKIRFKQIEIWTPGVLDVDIVMNSGFAPEFLQVLVKRDGALNEFQEFLKKYHLSSHVWMMGTKPL